MPLIKRSIRARAMATQHARRPVEFFRLTVIFMITVLLFIVALEGWRIARDYQQAFVTAGDSAANLTRAAAQHAEDTLRQVDSLLVGVRERIEGDGLHLLDTTRLHLLLNEQVRVLPQLHSLAIYDEQGRRRVSDKAADPLGLDNSDRDYFLFHKTHTTRDLHIGQVIISRITGELTIPVSRRVDHPDGRFAGVFLGAINVSYFSNYYAAFKIDDKGVFVLALRDGTILVRRPALEGAVGSSVATGEIFRDYLPRATEGILEMTSQVDDTPRLYGYKVIGDYPLVVEAGISHEAIVAGWRRDLIKSVGIIVLLFLGLCLFGINLLRQLRHRIRLAEELSLAHLAVQEMALKDSLTGLGNRRRLDQALESEILRARRSGTSLALIMLDIDYFKRFNDRYGHPAGDACLQAVAAALLSQLQRPGDLAVRYGGEELTIVLPETDAEGARRMAQAIIEAIRGLRIAHADSPAGRVTASAGVHVCYPVGADITPTLMVKAADAMLYAAKNSGRDNWRMAGVHG
jgi:diguanylate cyclase (GGDEF)-like protein